MAAKPFIIAEYVCWSDVDLAGMLPAQAVAALAPYRIMPEAARFLLGVAAP